jgi:hypothetical protein
MNDSEKRALQAHSHGKATAPELGRRLGGVTHGVVAAVPDAGRGVENAN